MLDEETRVEFPKWINRPARLVGYERDEIFVTAGSLAVTFVVLMLLRLNVLYILAFILLVPYLTYKAYKKYKEESTKGALEYLLYERNVKKPRETEEDIDRHHLGSSIIPVGYEQFFKN